MNDETDPERVALHNAWSRFATFDHNARVAQRKFVRLRISILVVGVAATALAIFYDQLVEASSARPAFWDWRFFVWLPMMSMPVLGSVLTAGAAMFARGVDWVHLRGAAEAVKREIYRYRCRVGVYGADGAAPGSRGKELAEAVGRINSRLMDTEVMNVSLEPYRGDLPPKYGAAAGDDGLSRLNPERYLEWRLHDQHAYFENKSRLLGRRHWSLQWSIAGLGGAGTLLAALGLEIWMPVTVGVATALGAYLAFRGVETTLAGYNRAALELDAIATWWSGLTPEARLDPARFETLVERTETLLGSENAGWVQTMQEAMEKLEKKKDERR